MDRADRARAGRARVDTEQIRIVKISGDWGSLGTVFFQFTCTFTTITILVLVFSHAAPPAALLATITRGLKQFLFSNLKRNTNV